MAGLTAAQGDGDGQSEMNSSMSYLRQYLNTFDQQPGQKMRVFFPDNIVSIRCMKFCIFQEVSCRWHVWCTFGNKSVCVCVERSSWLKAKGSTS